MDQRPDGGKQLKKYRAPNKEFFRLPNKIFDIPMTPIQFTIYAYLVCCAGSKGYCWPSIKTISDKTGISKTSVNEHLKVLSRRQIIEIRKQKRPGSAYKNNTYTLLDLSNPEVYRDLNEPNELPFAIDDIPAA
ncbi:MAG: helix-turn-helix domain-containing protein [Oscillospiraceae bacterium]|nr:helix-turn-helix domain-containing protein [Oscillospiraceae bacterium]